MAMVQPGDCMRFVNESLSACWGIESAELEELESNDAIELPIVRPVHHAHTALADLFQQVVMRYRSPLSFVTRVHAALGQPSVSFLDAVVRAYYTNWVDRYSQYLMDSPVHQMVRQESFSAGIE
jgi:hypothetical protein